MLVKWATEARELISTERRHIDMLDPVMQGKTCSISWLGVFSFPISLVKIERIYIRCLNIIIKSKVWTITHCLRLGHETMECAACFSIFLWWIIPSYLLSPGPSRYGYWACEKTMLCLQRAYQDIEFVFGLINHTYIESAINLCTWVLKTRKQLLQPLVRGWRLSNLL